MRSRGIYLKCLKLVQALKHNQAYTHRHGELQIKHTFRSASCKLAVNSLC